MTTATSSEAGTIHEMNPVAWEATSEAKGFIPWVKLRSPEALH